MPEYVMINIGAETAFLEKQSGSKWSKQIRAPDMPGEYKIELKVALPNGSFFTYEQSQNIIVTGKQLDMGYFGKLDEKLIKRIVLTYSGYASHVIFEDSTINVLVRMDSNNASVLEGIKKLLLPKIPAHLSLSVRKLYATCEDIKKSFLSCNSVMEYFDSCRNVLDYVPKHIGTCLDIKREFETCAALLSYPDWRTVMNRNAKDYAICNEIKTCFRTCADIIKRFETCDEIQIYTPVEPIEGGL